MTTNAAPNGDVGARHLLSGEVGAPVTEDRGPFTELQRRVKEEGLLRPRPGFYAVKIASNALLLSTGWAAFFFLHDSWWQLITAVYLAFCYAQTGLIGHDAGHLQIFRSRRAAQVVGFVHGNLLLGFSYGWWVGHHNRHHNYPNNLTLDPDILRRRVVFTPSQATASMNPVRRFIIRYQGLLFFPLLLLEAVGLRMVSIQVLWRRSVRHVGIEGVLIGLHLIAYCTALVAVLSPLRMIVFIMVQQGLFGLYLGSVFAPNHKGMPVRSGAESLDWLTRQVVTARNIRSTRFTDFWYGGLNYQIEHHLFPTMPRINLRSCRPIVVQFCRDRGIPYHEVSVWRSYAEVIGHLHHVATAVRLQAAE